jgi:DNA-binding MarR family transcriptional regulator
VSTAFTAEFERRLSGAGFPDLTFSLGTNVLRFLRPGPVRMSSLADMSGVTKQAISQQVAYLEAHGYVAVEPDVVDTRAKLVRLTAMGQRANEAAQSLFAAVERDWRHRFGGDEMRQLRVFLEDILDRINPSR